SLMYSSADSRHPPSFPTRRSSDLGFRRQESPRGEGLLRRLIDRLAGLEEVDVSQSVIFRHRGHGGGIEGEVGVFLLPIGEVAALDRKSTRLNSSHVKISYAVFCLK